MRVFDFTDAILREPAPSVVDGLRVDTSLTPSFDIVVSEHRAYAAALRDAGVAVHILSPLAEFPDSIFVEDPALVFSQGAILLRPGAPSRLGEREHMREALKARFDTVLELSEGEFADGGDVLVTPDVVLIGLSKRTTRTGAEALGRHLQALGCDARIAQTPPGILHFKTASSLLDDETILCTQAIADSGVFSNFRLIITPSDEGAAANALRVNARVFIGKTYLRTGDLLSKAGFNVVPLPVTEIAKLDAGLSCMSLRWSAIARRA